MRGRGNPVVVAMVAMVCWGCSDRSTPADSGVDGRPPEVGVELGLLDRGLVDAGPAEVGAVDLAPADAGTSFIGNRSEDPCAGSILVCKGKAAGCKLDSQHYIRGMSPGERKFIVSAAAGKKIRILIYLEVKMSPGSLTELSWFEPGCTGEQTLKLGSSSGTDLFTAAGSDNTFIAERVMKVSGDHLIEIYSDSTAKYLLRADVVN